MAYNMVATGIGVENLKIDAINSTGDFRLYWRQHELVGSERPYRQFLQLRNLFAVVQQLRGASLLFRPSEPLRFQRSLLLVEQTADSLIEDNIFYQDAPYRGQLRLHRQRICLQLHGG